MGPDGILDWLEDLQRRGVDRAYVHAEDGLDA
jgi:hypothetical protein